MKILKLIFIVILVIKAIQTEALLEESEDEKEETNEADNEALEEEIDENNSDDDVKGRSLQQIELYTNDDRCNSIGVCSDFDYGDENVIVSFSTQMKIRFTSKTTYDIKQPRDYVSLTFVNSKFSNFPLQLFYAFKPQELDFRNCSLKTLKWDNFLSANVLNILLMSENLLSEIKPSLFYLAGNLSFLFLDSNRISVIHNDSFKGLEKLNFLDLHNNLIEVLPPKIFSYLPALQQINLSENRLQIIETDLFRDNPRLFSIHLQYNNLNEIQDYAFQQQKIIKYLDLSHNSRLKVLVLGNIRVENLWAKNCAISRVNIYGEAVHVDLQQNSIQELYFSQPAYLETLRLKDNSLEQISSLSMANNLRTLDVSNNPGLKNLPDLMQINSLERIDLSNTSLKEIPSSLLNYPNKLRSINVSCNRIEEINPLNFKYLEKLTQFYIHRNNWNCYNLKMLMDVVIKPLKISYTHDEFDDNHPGEYIQGIQCMYRLEQSDEEYYVDSFNSQQIYRTAREDLNILPQNQLENTKEVEKLRQELKAIVGIYEQKFAVILNKLNELDMRLKEFERFNQTIWKEVAIVI